MNLNIFSVLILSEFIIAFMLSLVIALNSNRTSAKILSFAILFLTFDVGFRLITDYDVSWKTLQSEFGNNITVAMAYSGKYIPAIFGGAILIFAFLIMMKDNLPIEIEKYKEDKKEVYYWK